MNVESHRGKIRILVVDDHAISRHYTITALRQIAASVKQAATAGEALSLALAWQPHLILLDVELYGTSGFDLALQIRQAWPDAERQPRIIMLSAERTGAAKRLAAQIPVDAFLVKPVDLRRLIEAVGDCWLKPHTPAPSAEPLAELGPMFRQELAVRLDELDRCLADSEFQAASSILHQLIASSRLCRERRLERTLLDLQRACQGHPGARMLARCYFAVRASARQVLCSGAKRTPDERLRFRLPA